MRMAVLVLVWLIFLLPQAGEMAGPGDCFNIPTCICKGLCLHSVTVSKQKLRLV